MPMIDIEIEINHVMYLFLFSLTWLLVAIWARVQLGALYSPLPVAISIFTFVCIGIGSVGILGAIILIFTHVLN